MNDATRPLKLHLRIVDLPGATCRVLSLRPACGVRFSNNRFHETWHILTDPSGAAVLARLLWGLAFQRKPGTLVWIGDSHLVPTPFEADPPDPLLVAPAGLTRLDRGLLRALRRRMRRPGPPSATVKLQTFGMSAHIDAHRRGSELDHLWAQERMERREGVLCYWAPPAVLRSQALSVLSTTGRLYGGTSYHYLVETRWHAEGEVQVFGDFAARVSSARVARREALPRGAARIQSDRERWATWEATEAILARRRRNGAMSHGTGSSRTGGAGAPRGGG